MSARHSVVPLPRSAVLGLVWSAVLGLALSLFGVTGSAAQTAPAVPTGVRLVLSSCEAIVRRRALLDQLRIELLSTGVTEIEVVDPETGSGSQGTTERIATLHVYYPECGEAEDLVNLRISDRLTAKYIERTLFVSDVSEEARPRAVALAIVELLRASWLELVITPDTDADGASRAMRNRLVTRLKEATEPAEASATTPPPPAASSVTADAEAAFASRWQRPRIDWLAGGRLYPEGDSGDLSTAVSLSYALNRRLRLHTGFLAAGGGVNSDGNLHLFEAAARVGIGVSSGHSPEIECASIFEVGWARLNGREIETMNAAVAIGTLLGTLRTPITPGVDLIMGVQAGYVLSPVVRTQGPEARKLGGIEGPVVGVVIGLGGIL